MSGIRVDQNILNQKGTPAFNASAYVDRPTAGFVGRVFISTDTKQIFRDTGTAWDLISDAGSGSSNLAQVTLNGNDTPYGINITNGGLFLLGKTNGSIFFADGGSGQFTTDSTNFFWDNTNKRLGIGTASPSAKLDIHSSSGTNATFNGTGSTNALLTFQSAGTSKWSVGNFVSSTVANDFNIYDNVNTVSRLQVHNTGVVNIPTTLIIGTTTPTSSYAFDVTGTSRFTALITGLSATFSSTITATGTSTFNAGSSGSITLQTNGADNNWTSAITGANTTSQSYGLIIQAGTNSTDAALRIRNRANTLDWLFVRGDGNVGINTTTPSNTLDVNGIANFQTQVYLANGTAAAPSLRFNNSNCGLFLPSGVDAIGFATSNSERFRIASDGSMFNSNAPANVSVMTITANSTSGQSFGLKVKAGTTSGDTSFLVQNVGGSTDYFRVRGDGVLVTTLATGALTSVSGVITSSSDKNLKIDDGNINTALDKVLMLKPRYFYWKEETQLDSKTRQLGFYAQEVNEALGEEAANTPKDNRGWGISDRAIIAMLTKSIQELNEKLIRNNIN
jgi:hypothetical protein